MVRPNVACLLVILIAWSAGCDRDAGSTDLQSARASTRTPPVRGNGVIRGVVRLTGWTAKAPAARPVKCVGQNHDVMIEDETVVVSDGLLRDVVVYLKDAPASDGSNEPPVLLDQVNCRYVPHVVAVQVGQTLRIKSSDATLHNVHMAPRDNATVNVGMNGIGTRDLKFQSPERIRVRCDVHPWMNAEVVVLAHPFGAVSAADGSFEIRGVPAGQYTLVATHGRLGDLEQKITVADDKPADAALEYKPPQ